MKKTVKIIIGILILAAVSFVYGHIAKTHDIYDFEVNPDTYQNTGIMTDLGARQKFTSQEKHLDGVRIKCSVHGTAGGADTIITYELKDMETGEIVATGSEEGEDIENNKFHDFRFVRVQNSEGKRYEIRLYSNQIFGEDNSDGIGFYYENTTREENPVVVAENEVKEIESGTLVMKTITDRFDFETCAVFFIFALYVILFMRFLYKLFK